MENEKMLEEDSKDMCWEEFKERYKKLENLLGSEDEDLLLMRIEIAKLKAKKGKAIA